MIARRDEYTITTDPTDVDIDAVHAFLGDSYWARGIPRGVLERAIAGSLPFSLFHRDRQIGFARVITDRATYAYLADVYVLEEYRGQGFASWMMEVIVAHPDLQGLRRFALVTRDAQALYRKFGFAALHAPENHMEMRNPAVYGENQ
jgi:GNAT superfamily N-acetyltransferase